MSIAIEERSNMDLVDSAQVWSSGRHVVVKIGGDMLENDAALKQIFKQLAQAKQNSYRITIVHGGRPIISEFLLASGVTPQFQDGLRVTDEPTLNATFAALGHVNAMLVQALESNGIKASGLHADPKTFQCKKKTVVGATGASVDIGWVGEIVKTDVTAIEEQPDAVAVVSPIGWDSDKNRYNINADEAALAIADALQATQQVQLSSLVTV